MSFLILNWSHEKDVSITCKEDGTPRFFLTQKEAEDYAEDSHVWYWKVVEI